MDVSEDELREQIKANYNATIGYEKVDVTIKPIHNDAEKIIAEEYLESGSCEEGAHYYFACECGYISDITYTVEAHEHNLVHHEAQAPTCDAAGWEAYDVCEDCGYSTYEELLMFLREHGLFS